VKRLYGARSKDFIKDLNLINHLPGNSLETIRKFSDVSKSNNNVLSEVGLLGGHAFNHNFDNESILFGSFMVNNLFLAFQVDRATHQNQRGVKSIFVTAVVGVLEELITSNNNIVVDTLLFTHLVYANVSKHSKRKAGDGGVVLVKLSFYFTSIKNLSELFYYVTAFKEGLNALVAESKVDKGLKHMDQELSTFFVNVLLCRVEDESFGHAFRRSTLNNTLATIVVIGQASEN
jgi:hypothetical protein